MRSLNVDALHIFVGIATILINLAPKVPGFVLAPLVACMELIPAADDIGTWIETQSAGCTCYLDMQGRQP